MEREHRAWLGFLGVWGLFLALSGMLLPVALAGSDKPSSPLSVTVSPQAHSPTGTPIKGNSGTTLSIQPPPQGLDTGDPSGGSVAAPGDVLEVFDNTWSYSTLGLVYDPGRGSVRYAHESQSSTHRPTVFDVDALSHTPLLSVALSTVNSGWPWQIDNRDGVGYDFVHHTYFLPDYNGDLSYADDNLVEIDPTGRILNAWELDDEVGSNDSADGSEIDNVIDIAVVPGDPPRYFVTAAYDYAVVYEIALTKTGVWWTPNSWTTVATYTLPILSDNLGIDYDAEHGLLFHSDWRSTTILVTGLDMKPVTGVPTTFECPGVGGYNSGVTFIEGSSPPEIWVTDFSSDQTTRCQTPHLGGSPVPDWEKWVDGQPWAPDFSVSAQTGQVLEVTDVITAIQAFTLTETWNPDQLRLVNVEVLPAVGGVISTPGWLDVLVPAGPPEVVTITKWFSVQPCSWLSTTLEERLVIEGEPDFFPRSVTVYKELPQLHLDADYTPEVYAGGLASFNLVYSNTGGLENDTWIRNTFPVTAPFVYAEPFPDEVGPGGTWVRWNLGDLAQGDRSQIEVFVLIAEMLPTSTTVTIWDGLYDHLDQVQDEVWIEFHVNEELFPVGWDKTIDGQAWQPGISVTLETSQMLTVQEVITPAVGNPSGLFFLQEWDAAELDLASWTIDPPAYTPYVVAAPGVWALSLPPGVDLGPATLQAQFQVQPSHAPSTYLWEAITAGTALRSRPVVVHRRLPELWLASASSGSAYSGDHPEFDLIYGNQGGFESAAWLRAEFPPQAPLVDAVPAPTEADPAGLWARWDLGALSMDQEGPIAVEVEMAPGLPPSTTVQIWAGLYDFADELAAETKVAYHVPEPTWEKWVNGQPWTLVQPVALQTYDTFTVTDVISTRSAMALVEQWNPERLSLVDYVRQPEEGVILSGPDFLSWEFPDGAPGTITLTKIFSVEPCTWTYTVLWEELWAEGVLMERRPIEVDKALSELWLEADGQPRILSGSPTTLTLRYGNTGGQESRAWIRALFPPEAPFARSTPSAAEVDPAGLWATWDLGPVAMGEEDALQVTVETAGHLPPYSSVVLEVSLYDHVDAVRDSAVVTYTRGPALYLPVVLHQP